MAFLDSVTIPKNSGGFLGGVTAAPKGFVAPPPTPAAAPQSSLLEKAISYIKDSVVNQFQAGIQQANAGSAEANAPGANLGNRLEGALGTLSGAASALTSPLAPIFAPVGTAANFVGSKIGEIPAVQQFAQTPASDVVRKGAEIAQNVGNVAGALSLLEGGAKGGSLLEKAPEAPVEPHFLNTVVSPETSTVTPLSQGASISKASVDINRALVSKGFQELPPEELARFTPITKEDQLQKVSTLLKNDEIAAKQMAMGEQPIPHDVNSQVLFNAVKNKALETNDYQTLKDLASSPLASERALAAQKLGASGFNNGEIDPVSVIRDVTKAREASVEKRSGSIKTATTREVNNIKGEIKKANSKQTWSDFVQEITCSY